MGRLSWLRDFNKIKWFRDWNMKRCYNKDKDNINHPECQKCKYRLECRRRFGVSNNG